MKRFMKASLTCLLAASLAACGGSSTASPNASSTEESVVDTDGSVKGTGVTLTIYSNSVSDGRGDWLVERAKQDGFDLQYVDLPAADVQSRLIAEKSAPIADVTFGLNSIIWESLKSEDILTAYKPTWADEVSDGLNDPDDYYHATVKQAILLTYDLNQISEDEAPKDWTDLWEKDQFHGKYEYQTSLGGGTVRNVLAGILTRYADESGDLGISDEGWKAIQSYYQNGVPSESGVDLYAKIADSSSPVVMGQMWSSGIEARDEQYGVKTGYAVPDIGVPFAVEGVAIVNGTKNLDEAKRFVEWFGSAQIQGEWAEKFSTLPANTNAVDKANAFNQKMAKLKAQDIDWALVAENIDAWCEKIMLEYMP